MQPRPEGVYPHSWMDAIRETVNKMSGAAADLAALKEAMISGGPPDEAMGDTIKIEELDYLDANA